jgi:hypothetical protein
VPVWRNVSFKVQRNYLNYLLLGVEIYAAIVIYMNQDAAPLVPLLPLKDEIAIP